LKRAFKAACRKASIRGLRFHDLRHTFASRLVERGVDLITVKELLGHSTVKMTERYTHPYKEHKQMAVELLTQAREKGLDSLNNVAHICHTDGEKASGQVVKTPLSIN
jgi:integrase